MTRFNQTVKGTKYNTDTLNNCGAVAYSLDDKNELIGAVLTTYLSQSGKFYDTNEFGRVKSLAEKMANNDWEFLAKLTIYARLTFGLRSVSHLLISVLVKHVKSQEALKEVIAKICKRPDDMTEIMSCYISTYGKPVPNSLKKGLAKAFLRYDEYQLSKYKQDGKEMSLKDVMSIVHPVAKNSLQNEMFGRVKSGTLKTPDTWEVELSKVGANKAEVWKRLISEKKLGYLALLRNLRNIVEVSNAETISEVCSQLTNQEVIRKVGILPFTYYISYVELKKAFPNQKGLFLAIEKAMEFSVSNIERFGGKTLIAVDVSGSMQTPISAKNKTNCSTIASILGAIAERMCDDVDLVSFDTKVREISTGLSLIDNVEKINFNGGGTDVSSSLRWANEKRKTYDRIIIFSDNENNSAFTTHRETYDYGWGRGSATKSMEELKLLWKRNPNMFVHAVDLEGYGTQQMTGDKVNYIAGWSEKVLEFIHLKEKGISSISETIEQINI